MAFGGTATALGRAGGTLGHPDCGEIESRRICFFNFFTDPRISSPMTIPDAMRLDPHDAVRFSALKIVC
jgi:hypothetical protein